jgi:hypothetical protein
MNNFISEGSQVGSNVGRVAYALEQLNEHNIEYTLKNASTGHFHCRRKSDDRLVQFWASTGKIYDAHSHYGDTERGIHALIKYLEEWR